eukprot:SAG22_NODE_10473_length_533_cov_1.357143_1_plen_60_part_01
MELAVPCMHASDALLLYVGRMLNEKQALPHTMDLPWKKPAVSPEMLASLVTKEPPAVQTL